MAMNSCVRIGCGYLSEDGYGEPVCLCGVTERCPLSMDTDKEIEEARE